MHSLQSLVVLCVRERDCVCVLEPTWSEVRTVTTSFSQGGKRSMILHRKEVMVSP